MTIITTDLINDVESTIDYAKDGIMLTRLLSIESIMELKEVAAQLTKKITFSKYRQRTDKLYKST